MAPPTAQLANSAPLEQTPAEEESRKSISRSFKGTVASSTERKKPLFPLNRRISLEFRPPMGVLTPVWFCLQPARTWRPPQLLLTQL